ncbi:hypothetical protein P872_01260 [Rhodonellum psychrophilum GCM71 = DSM 17998]|uniref:YknX-like beta-barrel domain-containing protein n=2 Tax=Rhodonellum TaxID=336827 RepID=U5C4T1_9BACT|nr:MULTISPECIES: efflux RND transporter periplasmic adaptor subunit [Rhodonellum]ERM83916.1 hypothetical protein P872_01260 [Rhodonellum psychrophilum GCM71 = DSM 17998]MDO9550902.1 efflux RND transporter periplasmic adaptor subunit [Rhodonellum sp.]SDZ04917.1 Multidrug efflux pump subunit AcrA (membrane-fusion protein) [Rhodonellum ikkaensis]
MKPTLVSCFLLIFLLSSCGNSSQKTNPKREHISESVYASGIVRSQNQYQAYANASGLIQEIFVREGDSVDVGTPILAIYNESAKLNRENAELARLFADRKTNQSKLKDLEINIQLAKNRLQNDSLLWVRQQRLHERGIGSLIELEQRKLAFDNSQTAYQSSLLRYEDQERQIDFNDKNASKNLAISKVLESDFILRSKVKGRIYALLREKGEMVGIQTPLAVIGSDREFVIEMQVDEYDIVKVAVGQKILVSMDSYRGETFEAMISQINPLMDQNSKSFTVEGKFVRKPAVLYPNLTLEANILIQSKENALTLPRSYIYRDRYAIKSDGDTVAVVLGLRDFQKAEILEGLGENDQVIKVEK